MQPYFLPYIGYWQMMQAVDEFVVYDDVQFTRGWINRNRLLWNGNAETFTLPLRKGSTRVGINERYLTDHWDEACRDLQKKVAHAYANAPYFQNVSALLGRILQPDSRNLADFLYASLIEVKAYLGIDVLLLRSSDLQAGQGLRAAERIQAICKTRDTKIYVNAPGGRDLYDKSDFGSHGIELKFIQSSDVAYRQFDAEFVPNLSILDVMMFNDPAAIREMLLCYTLE